MNKPLKPEVRIALNSLIVIAGASLVYTGIQTRRTIDLGGSSTPNIGLRGNLLASRDNQPSSSPTDTFYEVSRLIKEEYVEPVKDEQKLASGSVRGMVASLGDPESLFMDKEEFRVYKQAKLGKYEGIGVDLALVTPGQLTGDLKSALQPVGESSPEEALVTATKIPKLTVTTVVPGSPAALAGVKPGDTVYSVDGHWVVSSDVIEEFTKAKKLFLAQKMSVTEINTLQRKLRAQTERALLPLKAKQKLMIGTGEKVAIVWSRGSTKLETAITKAPSSLPGLVAQGSTITLPFKTGTSEALKPLLSGKPNLTLDLRNNSEGDFAEMKKCLALVAPSGTYGAISNQRKEKPIPLTIAKGNPSPPKLTLLVDESTRGAAEIFALALAKFDNAKIVGTKMSGNRQVIESVGLPDGTGYCLVSGVYSVVNGGVK